MPQKRNNQGPPEVMTWGKALPVLIIAAVFDIVRFMFTWFIFFGPALAALFCTVGTNVNGLVCGVIAGAAGAAAAAAVESFGVVMAMATGFAGWLTVGLLLLMFNSRIFKENALWFVVSLLVSETPFLNSLPAITFVLWRMYRTQIRIEEVALKKYEDVQAAQALQERRQQEAQFMQIQADQLVASDVY